MDYKRLHVYFFPAIFASSLALMFFIYRPYLDLMLFSGILAILAWPVHRFLLRFLRGQRTLAALLTVVLTLILVVLPMTFVVVSLASEIVQVFNRVRTEVSFSDVEATLSRLLGPGQAHQIAAELGKGVSNVSSYLQPYFAGLTANVFALFSNTVAVLFGIFIVLIGMYYVLKDGPALKKELMYLSPLSDDDDTIIFDRIRDAVRAVAVGSFSVAITKGVAGGIAFALLGLEAPFFWGTMIALAHYVPGIGTGIITIPFAIYLFATGHFWQGLILTIVSLLVIGLVDNLLGPIIIKQKIHIHPFLILLSILGGLSFFGAVGVFFGPITLSVTIALLDIYKKEFRQYLDRLT